MKSKRFALKAKGTGRPCLVILLLVMLSSNLWASSVSVQTPTLQSIQNQTPQKKSSEISVLIQGGTLCQTLDDLGEKALGPFKCPTSLNRIKVTPRTIRGSNWQSIVSQLLRKHNTIVLWKNETELESIYLLSLHSSAATGTRAARAPNKARGLLEDITKVRTQWVNAPLSKELFKNPRLQKVFKTAQINSPSDWLDPKKQRRAKQELRKLYKVTQQKMNGSNE
jgi:hypothetical protein